MSLWPAPFLGKKLTGDGYASAVPAMRLKATVAVPGSKSLTNRYLILAALSDPRPDGTPIRLTAPLTARDTHLMADALRSLGVRIDQCDNNAYWLVYPPIQMKSGYVNCGLAGTVMRFIPPLAALADGVSILDGDAQARLRPMGAVIEGLVQLGINVTSTQTQTDSAAQSNAGTQPASVQQINSADPACTPALPAPTVHNQQVHSIADLSTSAPPAHLPIAIHGTGEISGGKITIDASASSQFVSGLLLAGARFTNGLKLQHSGGELPSLPHISMTVETLRAAGVCVTEHKTCSDPHSIARWHVKPGSIHQPDVIIEPDLSNAAPFMAAAMVAGGQVLIPYWPAQTTQPGAQLPHIFEQMGGLVRFYANTDDNANTASSSHSSSTKIRQSSIGQSTENTPFALDPAQFSELPANLPLTLEITGPSDGIIKPLDMDLHAVGELVPTIAAVAAFARGVSRLRNIGQLRGHETDRLAALTAELGKIGVAAWEEGNDLIIDPQNAAAQITSSGIISLRNSKTQRLETQHRIAADNAEEPSITDLKTAPQMQEEKYVQEEKHVQEEKTVVIESYADHRMATFGAILGLRIPNLYVSNIETTSKTLPNFVYLWETMLAESGASTESGAALRSSAFPSSSISRKNTANSPEPLLPIPTETSAQTATALSAQSSICAVAVHSGEIA